MLQRSPTYMVSRPSEDTIANFLRKILPSKLAYGITRWKNVLLQMFFFNLARKRPAKVKEKLLEEVSKLLPEGYDVGTHFTPRYNPWDQRLCLVPDADMFEAISNGSASIVTGEIDSFTPDGHPAEGRARRWTRTSSSPPPGSSCSWRATSPSPSTASGATCRRR